MAIDALILDYGGVVMHEDPVDYDPIGRTLGLADGELWRIVHGVPEYRPSRTGAIGAEAYEQAIEAHLCTLAPRAAVASAVDSLRAYYAAQAPIRPVMRTLLESLAGRVLRALLSNASRGSTARFEQRGLGAWFECIVCSGDAGVAKPEADAFRLVATRLGVAPERCALVDDVEENVAAARALGMHALHYHHGRHAELVQALAGWKLPVPDG